MYRHKIFRLCQRVHYLYFLLAGVPRNMHLGNGIGKHTHTLAIELIYDIADKLFIAGDSRCADDYNIMRTEIHFIMHIISHAVECRHRLALTSRGNHGHLFRRIILYRRNIDKHTGRHIHIAELDSRADNIKHASARYRDLSAIARRNIYYLLNAVNI